MNMKRYLILACVLLVSLWLAAGAGEPPLPRDGERIDGRNRDKGKQEDEDARREHGHDQDEPDADGDDDDDEDDGEDMIFLGRTYKLRMQMIPVEDDDEPHWLLVATREFEYELNFGNGREGMHFELEGRIYPVAGREEVLMVYHVNLAFHGDDGDGNVRASGSAVVRLGQEMLLTALGDHSLKVKVTGIDKPEKRNLAKPGAKDEIF